ncbi:MAG TPA: DNA mismatch repair endonuclease MutL [Bacteroidales bacterium]|nr:DNA mismatch repair endonuclease MutL [Bacteroidales bacterium]
MTDVVKLLPDSVANQIAAGEVIQRPASAVKELLENAIDAGATQIKLIIKDSGRTLIQVTDNGAGMSETDARMCFERHATSKISQASDLFSIRTMGFRGEALASIAAISRTELKTRRHDATLGTEIIIEGSTTLLQQPCQCQAGTSISVKNLFYNTPARRNFLKSDAIEKGHILQELTRVALAYPEVSFMYYQDGELTHQFEKSNLKQRIISISGSAYNHRLVPVDETTEIVAVSGYVIKPEFSKKKRGEQYFFVNKRFIRSSYLNHAVEMAFRELIPDDVFPGYFLFLETDPSKIDVNVHPTKTEIKFQDERSIYEILKSAVKRSLGRYNIAPTLDFERETAFDGQVFPAARPITVPGITVNPDYNPFDTDRPSSRLPGNLTTRINPAQWETLFHQKSEPTDGPSSTPPAEPGQQGTILPTKWDPQEEQDTSKKFLHVFKKYILVPVKSGIMVIDHQRAHERILFEEILKKFESRQAASQQLLFPENIVITDSDAALLIEMLPGLNALGFAIDILGNTTFVVSAVPAEIIENEPIQNLIEGLLENFKINQADAKLDTQTNLARSMARKLSVKHGKSLSEHEMQHLTDSLFACSAPEWTPSGRPVLTLIPLAQLADQLK